MSEYRFNSIDERKNVYLFNINKFGNSIMFEKNSFWRWQRKSKVFVWYKFLLIHVYDLYLLNDKKWLD